MTTAIDFRTAIKNGLKLAAGVAVGWLFLAWPMWAAEGSEGLVALTLAATLCLIPGWLVFAFQSQYGTAAPFVIVAAAGRMIVVLAGALAVKAVRPDLATTWFALALGAFYVLSLAIETKLLLTPQVRGTSTED